MPNAKREPKTDPPMAHGRDPLIAALDGLVIVVEHVKDRLSELDGSVSGLSRGWREADQENIVAIRQLQSGMAQVDSRMAQVQEVMLAQSETMKEFLQNARRDRVEFWKRLQVLEDDLHERQRAAANHNGTA